MNATVPHYRTIVGFCIAALLGYSFFSVWVVLYSGDAALRGDVIGTWKQMATGGFLFWVGSSMGGKARDAGQVTIANTPDNPVPTTTEPTPDPSGPPSSPEPDRPAGDAAGGPSTA